MLKLTTRVSHSRVATSRRENWRAIGVHEFLVQSSPSLSRLTFSHRAIHIHKEAERESSLLCCKHKVVALNIASKRASAGVRDSVQVKL